MIVPEVICVVPICKKMPGIVPGIKLLNLCLFMP